MADLLERVGTAPISWGICEAPGWGLQLPVDRVLGEARELGFRAIERGAIGWLPDEPQTLRHKLDDYGLTLLGGFVPLVLHDADQADAALVAAAEAAGVLQAAGAAYFVTAAVASHERWHHPQLTDAEWAELLANLDRVDAVCALAGLDHVVHPHLDTVIETADDLERVIADSSAQICFDTGHLMIGGADIVDFARDHHDRIGVVHLKDVDGDVAARRQAEALDLLAATQAGLFPPLGDGAVPLADVVGALEAAGYRGRYVIETDLAITGEAPPPGDGPIRGIARSLDTVRSIAAEVPR